MGFEEPDYLDPRIQRLQDQAGNTTAVLVPIDVWELMVQHAPAQDVPEWQKAEIRQTLAETKEEDYIPLDAFLKEWEKA